MRRPQPPLAVPAKPTGLTAAAGAGEVVLSWNDPNDAAITGWEYNRRPAGGEFGADWTFILGSGAATTSHTITLLEVGASYAFKLRAVNASGAGAESDEATVTLPAVPAKPTGLTATAGDRRALLKWTALGSSNVTRWQYSYKTTGGYGSWSDIDGSGATTTAHTVTELTNGTAHTFKVRAVNASGNGAASDEATATPLAVPAKPTGLTAAAGAGEVVLSWNDPNDAAITGWEYNRRPAGGEFGADWTFILGSGAATTSHTITLLEVGASYAFKLRAVNASGAGAESDEATVTLPAVPAKPTGLTATAGDRRALLEWTAPGGSTVTRWQYSYKTTGGYGSWSDIDGSTATTTAHTVTGLTNGTAHTFKVRAVNASGNGAASDEATATPLAVPAKPTGLTAAAGAGEVVLSWNDPNDAAITGWEYNRRPAGGEFGADWTFILGSGAATTSHTITLLEVGASYAFKLRAVNASGAGAESDEATVTLPAVPAKPTGLTATAGDRRALLEWTAPGGSTVTRWQYSYKTTGGYGSWSDIDGSTATTTAHTVTGLTNGTAHTFKVRAVNASGNGAASDEATATPLAVPAKPTGLTAAAGAGEVVLSWNDPNDAAITGWEYNRRPAGGEFEADWTFILGSGAITTSHTITLLEVGASYAFKLRAVNASGAGAESDEATVTLPAVPAKPTGLTATAGDRRALLEWTAPGGSTVTRWQYSYKTTGGYGSWSDIDGSTATTTAHTVTGLTNGTAHTFKVRAVNASGNGAASDEATATPLAVPAKPTGLTAAAGAGEVVLSWNDPNDAAITGWEYNRRPAGGEFGADWTFILGSGAATTSHTITLLEIGASYAFKLRAVNASGAGAESDEATVTLPAVPAKPTGFAATAGDGRVSLTWTNPGNSTIAGWQYSYRTTGGHGDWIGVPGSSADTAGYTVNGLAVGVSHTFRITAVNSSGQGAVSEEAAATPFAVPAKPTGFTATAGPGEVVLSWDDPKDTAIASWQYNLRPEGGEFEDDWTHILGSDAATTSYTVTGLEIGVSYGFKIRAVAGELVGAESDEKTAIVSLPSVPAMPTGFSATAGDREVALAWDNPDDPSIAGWQYRYKTTGGFGDWMPIPDSNADTTGYTVTGLEYGVSYVFRVRAFNAGGHSEEADEAAATSLPARPTGLTATAGDREVLLEWNDPGDDTIESYQYTQRRMNEKFEEDWTTISVPVSRSDRMRYPADNLDNGVSYAFKLRALNASGESKESAVVAATPVDVPDRPTNFTATPGDKRAVLRWQNPEDLSVTGWQYRYKTTDDFGEWIDIQQTDATTPGGFIGYTVTDLDNGITYFFQVRAVSESGAGPPSETATAPPEPGKPKKPAGLKAFPGYEQVLLTWDDPENASIVKWQYARWKKEMDLCRAGGEWIDAIDAPAARYVIEALEGGIAYCFQIRACVTRDNSGCGPGSDPVSATPKAVATRAEQTTVKAVLAGLAGHVAAGAEAVIGERFSAGPAESSVVLAGHELPLFAPVGGEPAPGRHDRERSRAVFGMDGRDALRNSAFQLSPGPPGEQGALQWSLWHRGDLMRFEGSAGVGSRYGGQLLSAWYGVDMRWDERWLAGTALARSKAEVDYAGGRSGLLKAVFDSVHPYLLRRFEDSGTAWITLGGGRGTIRNATAGRGGEVADAQLATASAGFRSPLPAFGGSKLSASGAAGFAQLETRGDARTAIGSLSAYTDRQSLGIEAALEEGDATYYTSLSLRRDSGDGANGIGLEFTKGVEAALPSLSGHATVRTRGLVWNSDGEYREFGVAAAIRRPAGPNGRGLSWSLSIARGTPDGAAGGPESFWRETVPKRGGGEAASSLNLSAGWGFVSRGSAFTPRAAFGLADANDRKLTLGIDMGPLAGPRLKLGAERRIPRTSAPESRVTAALEFRF